MACNGITEQIGPLSSRSITTDFLLLSTSITSLNVFTYDATMVQGCPVTLKIYFLLLFLLPPPAHPPSAFSLPGSLKGKH